MSLPKNLIVVRHAESEGNVVNAKLRQDPSEVADDKFLTTHNSSWKLTSNGEEQASLAGKWLRHEFGETLTNCYTSPYTRTIQTARLLDLTNSKWQLDMLLREREAYGSNRPESTNKDEVGTPDFIFTAPIGVETFAQVYQRVELFMIKLQAVSSDTKNCVIVTHSKFIWALRMYLEKMTLQTIVDTFPPRVVTGEVSYCHILQYSQSSDIGYAKVRSITPLRNFEPSEWQNLSSSQSYDNNQLEQFFN